WHDRPLIGRKTATAQLPRHVDVARDSGESWRHEARTPIQAFAGRVIVSAKRWSWQEGRVRRRRAAEVAG
ncbi:MAG: hypothetical protein OXP69_11765, partial [Spirochaetaceae bacterium]|nr:hypothetical protein [Spirochaetaceae bacterium]